jgi:ribosome-binding protein aMBF1 (putative translation factor)
LESSRDDAPKPKGKSSGSYHFKKETEPLDKTLAAMLGELLSEARRERGLTMQAVSEKLGISRGRIAQLESTANLELQTFVPRADVLGYDVIVTLQPRAKGQEALSALLD